MSVSVGAEYALVSEGEDDEPIELPTEEDGSLLLSTVAAQFAGASGLKYRAAGRLRGLRLVDERLSPPPGGWAAHRYFCAFPRPGAGLSPGLCTGPTYGILAPHVPSVQRPRCSDLIVLGLPWKTGEDTVRDYFAAFGELLMVQVKRDAKTGLSKGFGFIKFAEYEAQMRALGRRHMIDGRWCDVRIPNSKDGGAAAHRKVFVGRCTESLTADDLREYFGAFGQVTDVFVPKPFRAFSFVTFLDPEVAQSLCGQDHIIKGVSVNISTASPKRERGVSSASGAGGMGVGMGAGVGAGPGAGSAAGGAVAAGSRSALLGWGLLEGGAPRVFNWAPAPAPTDAWPHSHSHAHSHAHAHTPHAPHSAPPLDSKPYLKYE